jgi:hypothetical protein
MRNLWNRIAIPGVLALLCAPLFADQIVLRDGRQYSGKFIRADLNVVEFRVAGKVETFRTTDVAQIVFQEPELLTSPPQPRTAPPAPEPARTQVPQETRAAADSEPVPVVTLPEGTRIIVRTTIAIDTDRNRVGDPFDAVLEQPLALGSQVLVPRGVPVKGRIAYSRESGKLSGQSMLILELTELITGGRTYQLSTTDYSQQGASRGKETAGTVGGGAALGAIIGAIAGGGKGAAIGAATGAAVGAGVQVVTSGETLKVPAETVLEFRLQHPLAIEVR